MVKRLLGSVPLSACWLIMAMLVCLVVPARPAVASEELWPLPAEEFRTRLKRLLEKVDQNAIALLKGAPPRNDFRPFRQYNTFFYFTGYEHPNAVLLVDGLRGKVVLYVEPRQRLRANTDRLRRQGISEVRLITQLAEGLRAAAAGAQTLYLPRFPGEGPAQARDSFRRPLRLLPAYRPRDDVAAFRHAVLELLGEQAPQVRPLETLTDPLRRVKSQREIALMREAARITALAIRRAIRRTRAGILEAELAGICEATFLEHGAFGSAWTPIVASGPNMIELHYMRNNRELQDGDMLLLDTGPDYHYYTSDVTRCWPVSGPFPEEYAELYDKLVEVHRAGIAEVRPGKTMYDVLRAMHAKARELGIHRHLLPVAGHYTGMAVHDVGAPGAPFEPGVVFNVEPLLIVRSKRLHLRLEDTVLCTADGPEVLTPLQLLPWNRDAILAIRDEAAEVSKRSR